jgi:RNA polymerase sigma-70 factor (ECF subfamily)
MKHDEALITVVEALAPGLLRYCLGRSGDAALAEDAAQEALAALVQRWRRRGAPRQPEAFAFAIARRRLGRNQARGRRWLPLAAVPEPTGAPSALHQVEHRVALERTLQHLAQLPEHEREALLLIVSGGLSTAAAANVLGVSPSAVKMRVHRARQRLVQRQEKTDG